MRLRFSPRRVISTAVRLCVVAVLSACSGGGGGGGESTRVAVAWNSPGGGKVGFIRTAEPFEFEGVAVAVGANSVLAARGSTVYAVSRSEGTITAVDAGKAAVRGVIDLGSAAEPQDVAVVDDDTAYVTRRAATSLLRVDLNDGSSEEVIDLGAFADADGIPDLGRMTIHGGRLFVQVGRANAEAPGGFEAPAMIAVVDIATESLVDADPDTAGIQAIELAGTAPKTRMQLVAETNALFVSATGGFFDHGGIEIVDLQALRSEGLAIAEADGRAGADLGPFVMVTPERGYLVFSTDLILSSHLLPFTRADGVAPGPEMNVSVDYFAPALAFDPESETLYAPEGDFGERGVHVFDTSTNQRLTETPIPTDGPPTDLLRLPEN